MKALGETPAFPRLALSLSLQSHLTAACPSPPRDSHRLLFPTSQGSRGLEVCLGALVIFCLHHPLLCAPQSGLILIPIAALLRVEVLLGTLSENATQGELPGTPHPPHLTARRVVRL